MKSHSMLCLCKRCISKLVESEDGKEKVDLFIEALEHAEIFETFQVLRTKKGVKPY